MASAVTSRLWPALGDGCGGDCLLAGGQCIHGWNGRRPQGVTWRVVLDRRWWHRVLWGR